MAKTSMKVKQARPAKFSTREYNRCKIFYLMALMASVMVLSPAACAY